MISSGSSDTGGDGKMELEEFILELYAAGWDCSCDAQHRRIEKLWEECLETNKEPVTEVPCSDRIITTDCARQINENLKGLSSSDERLQLLEMMSDDICIHCGDVNKGRCHCTNDE